MISLLRVTLIIFVINLILMSYTYYIFYIKFNQNSFDAHHYSDDIINEQTFITNWNRFEDVINEKTKSIKPVRQSIDRTNNLTIEIWSKAAIGLFLWEHIIKGKIDKSLNNVYMYGLKRVDNYKFKFRSGAALTPNSLMQLKTQNLILVLNARDKEKKLIASNWINTITSITKHIKNVGLIVLGDEECHNNWINSYLSLNGGPIRFVFIVYDWNQIDDRVIYQWPLGVATYRQFPNPDISRLNVENSRPYVCNLIATIYPDSSRQQLYNTLNDEIYRNNCIIKPRFEWQPKETKDSLNLYVEALHLSDLTLSPIGMNHECYRVFEAMAFGSVPVIEINLNHVIKTNCDKNNAFRLLKQYNAPVIYVNNWTQQLPVIIKNELKLSLEYKIKRRIELVKWYQNFKFNIKNKFIDVINEKFL